MPEKVPENGLEEVPEKVLEKVPEKYLKKYLKRCLKRCLKTGLKRRLKRRLKRCLKRGLKRCLKRCLERYLVRPPRCGVRFGRTGPRAQVRARSGGVLMHCAHVQIVRRGRDLNTALVTILVQGSGRERTLVMLI